MNSALQNITFSLLNARGIRSKKRQQQLHRVLLEESPDVLAVQESKLSTEEQVDEALRPFLITYEVCFSHEVGTSEGCLMFFRRALPLSSLSLLTDEMGRFILCDFTLLGKDLRIICVYAPNSNTERLRFFDGLRPYCDCDRQLVLMGDFNCVCDPADRLRQDVYIDRSARFLDEMVQVCDLIDVGKYMARWGVLKFTRFQPTSHARLDRIYMPLSLARQIASYNVNPIFFSDHCLATVNIGRARKKSNPFDWRLWKLNSKLLTDKHFEQTLLNLFDRFKMNLRVHLRGGNI